MEFENLRLFLPVFRMEMVQNLFSSLFVLQMEPFHIEQIEKFWFAPLPEGFGKSLTDLLVNSPAGLFWKTHKDSSAK